MNKKIILVVAFLFCSNNVLFLSGCSNTGKKAEELLSNQSASYLHYWGEELLSIDKKHVLVKFISTENKNLPLIIFVPGIAHLARISYGFPGADKNDFLGYWIHKQGFPFLAISYPLGNKVFPVIYPEYSIKDWAKSIVLTAKYFIKKHRLNNNIVILGWSMAGEIVEAVNQEAKNYNVNLQLFIVLSASPPIFNLYQEEIVYNTLIQNQNKHLTDVNFFKNSFWKSVKHQNELNKHVIISEKVYFSEFIGDCPVNIMGTALRFRKNKYVIDINDAIQDTGAFKFESYPFVAVINGEAPYDPKATFFHTDWSIILARKYSRELLNYKNQLSMIKIKKFIDNLKGLLFTSVPGSHFFFLGKVGARSTAEKVTLLVQSRSRIFYMQRDVLGCAEIKE